MTPILLSRIALALSILTFGLTTYSIGKDTASQKTAMASLEPAPSCPEPTVSFQPKVETSHPDAGPPVAMSAKVAASRHSAPVAFVDRGEVTETGAHFGRLAIGENHSGLVTGEMNDDHWSMLQTLINVRAMRSRVDKREWSVMETMEFLAPRISGLKPASRRQTWVGGLPAVGNGPPLTWVDTRSGAEETDGDWRLYRDGWASFRAVASAALLEAVMSGEPGKEPCPGEPIAYGCYGEKDCDDDPQALKRGLCLLDCGKILHFWAKPGRGCELDDPLTTAARVRVAALTPASARGIVRPP